MNRGRRRALGKQGNKTTSGGRKEGFAKRPSNAADFASSGLDHYRAGRYEQAIEAMRQAVARDSHTAHFHSNLGAAYQAVGRLSEAVASYRQALALQPDSAVAHHNLGAALEEQGDLEGAVACYQRALTINPDYTQARESIAYIRGKQGEADPFIEALAACDRAIALAPQQTALRVTRAQILCQMQRVPEALAAFDVALALDPTLAAAHDGRASALTDLGRLEDALAACEQAIALSPGAIPSRCRRGDLLWSLGRLDEAVAEYDRVLALDPTVSFAEGLRMHMKMLMCAWDGLDAEIGKLVEKMERGEKASLPFPMLSACGSPTVQRRCAEIQAAEFTGEHIPALPGPYPTHQRIRIGYFASILHEHATACLLVECLEKHDAARFDLTAFSYGPSVDDAIRRRFNVAFDHFMDVSAASDTAVVALARKMEIDIAVDLNGWTKDARARIFALRAAPVQVNYLGYPGTMGALYMDYLIADPILIPTADRQHYAEKIVTLPDSYQPNDRKRPTAGRLMPRRELGLPEEGFVFCCFNNTFKITPEMFAAWLRILRQVDGSVLWLLEDNPYAARNLRLEAERCGIDPARLIFAPRVPSLAHLARQPQADLFLDTASYGAHTTASDALWLGLPVLTVPGAAFASRVAASLLTAAEMPELIAPSLAEYENRAVFYATLRDRLQELRDRLVMSRESVPLFDSDRYTRHLEAAYAEMYRRHREGLPPDHIVVAPGAS